MSDPRKVDDGVRARGTEEPVAGDRPAAAGSRKLSKLKEQAQSGNTVSVRKSAIRAIAREYGLRELAWLMELASNGRYWAARREAIDMVVKLAPDTLLSWLREMAREHGQETNRSHALGHLVNIEAHGAFRWLLDCLPYEPVLRARFKMATLLRRLSGDQPAVRAATGAAELSSVRKLADDERHPDVRACLVGAVLNLLSTADWARPWVVRLVKSEESVYYRAELLGCALRVWPKDGEFRDQLQELVNSPDATGAGNATRILMALDLYDHSRGLSESGPLAAGRPEHTASETAAIGLPPQGGDQVEQVEEETLSIWSLQDGRLVSALEPGGSVSSVGQLPGGLVVWGRDTRSDDPDESDLLISRVPGLATVNGTRVYGGEDNVWTVRVNPHRPLVAVTGGYHGGPVYIFDHDLRLIAESPIKASVPAAWVTSDLLAVAKCTGDYETLPVLLNADSGKVEREFPVGTPLIHNLSADLAGHYIAYSGGNIEGGPGVVVCSRTGERVLTRSEGQYISASCISPDGRFVAWSADSNRSLSVVEIPTGNMLDFGIRHAKTISAIAFNQSSSLIASGCLSGFVVVWSLSPPKRVAKFKVQQGVNDIAFTEDDRYLIVASTHPDVMIFD